MKCEQLPKVLKLGNIAGKYTNGQESAFSPGHPCKKQKYLLLTPTRHPAGKAALTHC